MRILADENFPADAVEALRAEGHDVAWVRTVAPGIKDSEVVQIAQQESRVIVTFDKDFGELAFRLRLAPNSGIILFRLSPMPPTKLARFMVNAIKTQTDWYGNFSVVEPDRIRIRSLQ
jgi:predicted nuclease of predicted toxin-antitoxin system